MQTHNVRKALLAHYPSAIDFSRTVAVGHSLGGVASELVAITEKLIRGAVNMDGGMHEPVSSTNYTKPIMQFGREGHEATDSSWDEFWPNLRGPAAEVAVANATHGTFTDVLTLMSQFDLPPEVRKAIQEGYGSIDPIEAEAAIAGALVAGFEFVFDGHTQQIDDIHKDFPALALKRSHMAL